MSKRFNLSNHTHFGQCTLSVTKIFQTTMYRLTIIILPYMGCTKHIIMLQTCYSGCGTKLLKVMKLSKVRTSFSSPNTHIYSLYSLVANPQHQNHSLPKVAGTLLPTPFEYALCILCKFTIVHVVYNQRSHKVIYIASLQQY